MSFTKRRRTFLSALMNGATKIIQKDPTRLMLCLLIIRLSSPLCAMILWLRVASKCMYVQYSQQGWGREPGHWVGPDRHLISGTSTKADVAKRDLTQGFTWATKPSMVPESSQVVNKELSALLGMSGIPTSNSGVSKNLVKNDYLYMTRHNEKKLQWLGPGPN